MKTSGFQTFPLVTSPWQATGNFKFNLFTTSMIFAVYWTLWHLPLAFIEGYYHSNLVESGTLYSLNFLFSILPFVLLMNWLYYKSGRNILVAVVLHLGANVFNEIFATHPDSKVIQTGLLLALSGYLLITQREFFFEKTRRQFDDFEVPVMVRRAGNQM